MREVLYCDAEYPPSELQYSVPYTHTHNPTITNTIAITITITNIITIANGEVATYILKPCRCRHLTIWWTGLTVCFLRPEWTVDL